MGSVALSKSGCRTTIGTMTELGIRAATPADAALLARWNELPHVRAAVSDDGVRGFDCDWAEELQPRDDGGAYFVAEADGRPIGAMQIIDPAEQDFPFEEPTLFRGLEAPLEEFVEPRAVRRAYRQEFERFRQALESGCRQLGIDYVLLRTDRALDVALSGFLVRRTRRAMRT